MPKRFDSEEERRRYFREKQALAREKRKNLGKGLPAVSVLAEPEAPDVAKPQNGVGEARESTIGGSHATDSRGGRQRPSYIPEKEWELACERAERARRYAGKFPQFVKRGEEVYQDAMWQWENEVRGRFGGVVGGSLSGTRG